MRAPAVLPWIACCGAAVSAQGSSLESRFRADLEVLTSLAAEGREVGTRGGWFAERHLVARFAEIGLAPAGPDGFRQPFTVDDPRPMVVDPARTVLRLTAGRAVERFELGVDYAPCAGSPEGRGAARLVDLGYAIGAGAGSAASPAVDRDECVAIVRRGAPADSGVAGRDPGAVRFESKLRVAAAAGARAALLFDPDERSAEDSLRSAGLARRPSPIPTFWVTRPAAMRLFDALGVAPPGGRHGDVPPGDRDDPPRPGSGAQVEFGLTFAIPRAPRRTANVIGMVEGWDPSSGDEIVVVGAHHDHIGRGLFGSLAPGSTGQVHPGADDNASGCAALLAAATLLRAAAVPRRTVLFVAFGAEESGLRGSEFLLESGVLPEARIVAMINLNMVGRAMPGRLRIEGVGTGDGLEPIVRAALQRSGVRAELRAAAASRSDHATFLSHRVPAMLITSGLHDSYHTPADREATVVVTEALGVARLAVELVRGLADADGRPRFASIAPGRSGGDR